MKISFYSYIIEINGLIISIKKGKYSFDFPCHCMPERCPHFFGYIIPPCWRCHGMFQGFLIFFFTLHFFSPLLINPVSTKALLLFILLSLPLVIDGTTQFLGDRLSNNALRYITGLLFGISFPGIFYILKHMI